MAAAYNKVILVGNLTRDVDLRRTQTGLAVANVGLAINDRYKRKDGTTEESATFVDVTLWDRLAEVASQYLRKGSSVLIDGHLELDQWEQDGQKRSKLKVVGERMQMLGASDSPREHSSRQAEPVPPAPFTPTEEDDCPF